MHMSIFVTGMLLTCLHIVVRYHFLAARCLSILFAFFASFFSLLSSLISRRIRVSGDRDRNEDSRIKGTSYIGAVTRLFLSHDFVFFSLVLLFVSFITDSSAKSRPLRSNTVPSDLLPHDIITYGDLPRSSKMKSTVASSESSDTKNSRVPNTFLATLQITALKDLSKFTGDSDQEVNQFINAVEHIRSFTALNDAALHALATVKLGGLAFKWYDSNKSSLNTWDSLKLHLLDRFQPSRSTEKTQLRTRRQQPGELLSVFNDDILSLCTLVDAAMPTYMIVDYLQDGVRDDLQIHIKRRLKTVAEESTPAMFLKIARDEEELQREISFSSMPAHFPSPYFASVTVAAHASSIGNNNSSQSGRSQLCLSTDFPSASRARITNGRFRPCLICHRSTHRTIDCYSKKTDGCFKCGDTNHVIRNSPQVFQ